jgi:adenylate cyclase
MSVEIERKYLVTGDAWREHASGSVHIRQAFLALDGKASVRVRIRNSAEATLTVKSRAAGLSRLEFEYPVPLMDAEAMLPLRLGAIIEKRRWLVPYAGMTWEIDTFLGDNDGLVVAEIELRDEHQQFDLPHWIGREVTGSSKYYNSSLARRPYCTWSGAPETALA